MTLRTDPGFVLFAALLLATGLMRLVEAVVSARRLHRRPHAVVAEPWVFPSMALLHVAVVAAPLAEVLWWNRPFLPALAAGAGTILLLGTALRVWTLRTIGGAWNVRVVVPDNEAVVTTGPYAWIRHPNYLAVILELFSLPLLHTAWISCLVLSGLNGLVLCRRIRTEESRLATLPTWREAMAGRARLVPGLF